MTRREYELLREIRARPAMFVPSVLDVGGVRSLSDLELFLRGFEEALHEGEPRFLEEFSVFLRDTRGWSLSSGPMAAIDRHAPDTAWNTFWTLYDEFMAREGG